MEASQPPDFDFEAHEAQVNEFFEQETRRRARVRAFDYLVDLALDGQIKMSEALQQYRTELDSGVIYGELTAGA